MPWLNLGAVLHSTGDKQGAHVAFEKALSQPGDGEAEVHSNLGSLYSDEERYDLSIQHYEAAVTLKPDLLEALSGLISSRRMGTRMNII